MESPTTEPLCQRCGRPIRGAAPRCVVCGWSEDEELRALDDAGRVRRETLRCASTIWPFVLWTAAFGFLATLTAMTIAGPDGPDPDQVLLLVAFLAAGPGILALRLWRNRRGWVQLDPEDGLVISGKRRVAWDDIVSIEHEHGLLGHHESWSSALSTLPMPRLWKLSGLLIPVIAIYFVVLPVLVELTPWGAREVVVLRDGERFVLRDLDDGLRFVQSVRYGLDRANEAAAA